MKKIYSYTLLLFTLLFGQLSSQDTTLVLSSNSLTLSSCDGDSATLTAGVVAAYYGTGADGDISFSSGTNYTDGIRSTVTGSNSLGSSTLELDSIAGLAVNDEILIITMQDDNTSNNSVGTFEFKVISSISSNTLTFTESLLNDYNASSTVKHQVIKVPNYNNVTISSGATLTAHPWDGSTGGIVCFRATGQVSNSGSITASAIGYRGVGHASSISGNQHYRNMNGAQGEGIYGIGFQGGSSNGSNSTVWNGANGNGGGGGTGRQDAAGGGGGGYANTGNNGGSQSGHTGGSGGNVVGIADLSKLIFGGAGGEGGADEDGHLPGKGGNGGGIIFISAASVVNSGTISSDGEDAGNGTNSNPNGSNGSGCGMGGGGGGAGGSIFISSTVTNSGSITADKGNRGTNNGCGQWGGWGSDGRIAIASPGSSFPTTSPVANEASLPVISGYTYVWSDGSSNNTLLVSPNVTTTYSVTATSGSSTLTKDLTITVLQNPSVPDINDVSHCPGTFTFSAPVDSGATLVWYSSANDSIPIYYGNTFTTGTLSTDSTFYYSSIAGNSAPVGDFADAPVEIAVGLRKLIGSYNGNAIKLRRSSDNAEQDFGFTSNGELDVTAIQIWLGSSTGYVKTIYDQSGNSRDFTHSTTSRQPELLISGVNSMPTLNFTTSNQLRMTSNVLSWPLTIIGTAQLTSNSCGRVFGGSGGNFLHGFYSNIINRFHYDTWLLNSGTHNVNATNSIPYIVSSINPSQNSHSFYSNGNFLQTVNSNGNAPNGFTLNGHGNGSQLSNVKILELIIYGAAITVDELNAVESNIAERYGVPYSGATSSVGGIYNLGIYCGENPNRKSVSAIVDATLTEDATFSYSKASYCAGDNNPTANVAGTLGGTFTSTTGLALDPTTGAIDLANSTDGTYTVTYTTSTNTCGATSTFDIVISSQSLPTVDAGADVTICDGGSVTLSGSGAVTYSWDNNVSDGVSFSPTATATYTVTGTDANGCSNTDAVDVTVNLIYYNLLNITTCSGDSVYAGGNYQTTSGIYVDSLQSTDGCDSIVETTLTISSQIIANLSVSVCYGDSALINGSYQAASGIFYDTTINASGCDSVTVTSFTVDNLISSSASAEICSGDSLFIGGAYQSTAGNYVDTFSAVSGCDSLVTTTLTVNTASSSTDTHQAACDFTWIDGITYTASNSTATFITSNALGCDSVVTLDLTINPIIATIAQNGNDIEATASNGTAPYYYEWNTGETTATITPNVNGPYWVVVSDADTCYSDTASFDVTFVSGTGIKTINDILSIYPNPTNENVIISIDNYYGNIKTEVFDLIGNKLQTTSKTSISLRDYSKGIYILKVTYGNIVEEIKVIKE